MRAEQNSRIPAIGNLNSQRKIVSVSARRSKKRTRPKHEHLPSSSVSTPDAEIFGNALDFERLSSQKKIQCVTVEPRLKEKSADEVRTLGKTRLNSNKNDNVSTCKRLIEKFVQVLPPNTHRRVSRRRFTRIRNANEMILRARQSIKACSARFASTSSE